jgi:hypothetical protein
MSKSKSETEDAPFRAYRIPWPAPGPPREPGDREGILSSDVYEAPARPYRIGSDCHLPSIEAVRITLNGHSCP